MAKVEKEDRYRKRNDSVRLELYDRIDDKNRVMLRKFLREIALGYLFEEHFEAVMGAGDALIFAAVRDRPWPPWGLGGQRIHGLILAAPAADDCLALSPVFTLGNDTMNIGLSAALLKELLDHCKDRKDCDVCYPVIEGSVWTDQVLRSLRFEPSDEILLTDAARYTVYRVKASTLSSELGYDKLTVLDLLSHELEPSVLSKIALFHATTVLATLPGLLDSNINRRPEIIIWGGGGLGAACPAECLPSSS